MKYSQSYNKVSVLASMYNLDSFNVGKKNINKNNNNNKHYNVHQNKFQRGK